jgi:hypothetical protein
MDSRRFDALTVAFGASLSRREFIVLLVGGLAIGTRSVFGASDVEARKQRRKGKRPSRPPACPPCGTCRVCQNGSCVPVADATACGDCGRCAGGTCATADDRAASCGACATCEAGACLDKPIETPCGALGRCANGECRVAPFCDGFPANCNFDTQCCSGQCLSLPGTGVRYCTMSELGQRCDDDADCASASCVAFRCR